MQNKSKVLSFLRTNAVYIVLALCILAVGLTITLSLITQNEKVTKIDTNVQTDEQEQGEETKEYIFELEIPIKEYSSKEDYSSTMVFNSTLKRFSSHTATDYIAQEGTEIYTSERGVVESVEKDILTGVTVVIDHQNGIKTVYNSLDEDVICVAGDILNKGELIGYVSNTNRQENYLGSHLHFEILKDGKSVDPAIYFEPTK